MSDIQILSNFHKSFPFKEQKYTTPGKIFYSSYKVAAENNVVIIKKTGEANIFGLCPSEYQFRLNQPKTPDQLAQFKKLMEEIGSESNAKDDPKWKEFLEIINTKEAVTEKEIMAAVLNQTETGVKKLMQFLLLKTDQLTLIEELVKNDSDSNPYAFSDKEVRLVFKKLVFERYEEQFLNQAHQSLSEKNREYQKISKYQELSAELLKHLDRAYDLYLKIDFKKPHEHAREISAFNGEMTANNELLRRLARSHKIQERVITLSIFDGFASIEYKEFFMQVKNLKKQYLDQIKAMRQQFVEEMSAEEMLDVVDK